MGKLIVTGKREIKIEGGKLRIKCLTDLCKWRREKRFEGVVKRQT